MKIRFACATAVLFMAAATTASAQTQRQPAASSTGGAQLQALQQQLQQAAAERTALQGENDKLKKELQAARTEATKLKGAQAGLRQQAQSADASLRALTSSKETTEQSMERQKSQFDELIGKFRETTQTLGNVEGDRTRVRNELAARERELNTCIDANLQLYKLNGEVLTRLEERGFFSSMASHEPFTRVSRARLENLIDDTRYRAAELKLAAPKAAAPAK